jgi:outer membrane protein TolC
VNGIPPQTAGRVSFNVRAPLMRNAGTEATTANLSAAEADLTASRYDLVFTNAQALFNTTLAYWNYLAQLRRLDIAREAEGRALRLTEETRKLIAADEAPAADIQIVQASGSERQAARIATEQALAEARLNLALQIGLPPERLAAMPPPADDFPDSSRQPIALDTRIADLLDVAYRRRADLEAARHRERAARRRLDSAISGLKPQVDLTLGVGYDTLVEQRAPFSLGPALSNQRVGPSVNATLSMLWPWRNVAAEGVFVAQSAALAASLVRVRNLAETIGNNIYTDVQALVRSAQQLAQAAESTRLYRTTVDNERTKRRLGLVTLIDVITVEDRLTNALLAEVQARQAYANSIAQLRFDMGTIVVEREGQFDVVVEDLLKPDLDIVR